MNRISWLLRRAKQIRQNEGLVPLVRRGFRFLAGCFFVYGSYYVYETDIQEILKERNEADCFPRIEDFTLRIVSTN